VNGGTKGAVLSLDRSGKKLGGEETINTHKSGRRWERQRGRRGTLRKGLRSDAFDQKNYKRGNELQGGERKS